MALKQWSSVQWRHLREASFDSGMKRVSLIHRESYGTAVRRMYSFLIQPIFYKDIIQMTCICLLKYMCSGVTPHPPPGEARCCLSLFYLASVYGQKALTVNILILALWVPSGHLFMTASFHLSEWVLRLPVHHYDISMFLVCCDGSSDHWNHSGLWISWLFSSMAASPASEGWARCCDWSNLCEMWDALH